MIRVKRKTHPTTSKSKSPLIALSNVRARAQALLAGARLERVPNPERKRRYVIEFTIPEFTCLCPVSGFPDFATIHIRYTPKDSIVELKSLKLYILKFRDQGIFHEAVANRVLDDLVSLLKPHGMEVVCDFSVRGNIKTVVRAKHGRIAE